MTATRLPGSAWLLWLRNFPLRVGVLTGAYLSAIMIVAVLAANRLTFLESVADLRNATFAALFALTAAIPLAIFVRKPAELFLSGMAGWLLFALAYRLTGVFFENLFSRLGKTPFHAFMLGAIVYGLLAVTSWVASMVLLARHQPIAASRRRPY